MMDFKRFYFDNNVRSVFSFPPAARHYVASHSTRQRRITMNTQATPNTPDTATVAFLDALNSATGPALRFQGLMWPVADHAFDNASYDAFANGYFPSRDLMKWFWIAYTIDEAERNERYASPLRASLDELKGLPPALIQTAQFDVLRDEGEAFGYRLDQAGNDVTTTRYKGTIHDFGLLNVLAADAPTRTAVQQMATALKTRLQ
ncbi:alpha/beta hydrolase fold domain-containing protein [Burkholderia cepacia]|uniref:alpha/beta hydrolase fold domain-containing protein n=2 Tax=Burkholderia cepacia TaxID=292 RepID=UPI002EDB8EC8